MSVSGPRSFAEVTIGATKEWDWAKGGPYPLLETEREWAENYFACYHLAMRPQIFEAYCNLANDVCESPIEHRMLAILSCALPTDTVVLKHDEQKIKGVMKSGKIAVIPQAVIAGKWRADFLILMPTKPRATTIVIECDGAAYHLPRMAQDQERNREFHRLGITVMRFWGKQIHAEPKAIGDAIALVVRQHMQKQRAA